MWGKARLLKRISSSPHGYQILAAFTIFLLALLPRLSAIDRSVTPDELHWVDRSLRFSDAIAHGQWADTVQAGHPGVTTLWLGSLGIAIQRLITPTTVLPDLSGDFAPQDATAMRALAKFLTAARLPVIFVTAFNITLLFLLLSRVVERHAAFAAAALLALDPFAISLGSILHVDSLLTTFSLASLAALGVAIDQPKTGMGLPVLPGLGKLVLRPTRWSILSGALAGLAMLSKSPAIMLAPAVFIIVALNTFRQRRSLWHFVRVLFIWGATAAIVFVALYPAMWAAPKAALDLMSNRIETFSETAHAVNYFFGSHDRDPGAAFYPVVIAYRSTPMLLIGLVAAVGLIVRAQSGEDQRLRETGWMYWVFAVLFLGVITLGAKKLDRYVLPALEALNVVGAFGLMFVANQLLKRRRVFGAVMGLALAVTAWQFISVWPLTMRAYNLLAGGYDGASRALPAGGGEGEEVAAALNNSPFASNTIAATDIVGTAPFFTGRLVPTSDVGLAQADYMLFNASDFQLTPQFAHDWTNGLTPVLTLTVQGRPFAWLYANAWLTADRRRVQQRQRDDAVIVDEAAAQLPVPIQAMTVITTALTPAQAIDLLQNLAQAHRRVFAFHYASQPDRNTLELFRALDTYAVNLDQWSSPLSFGGLYALPDQAAFVTQPLPLNGNVTFGDRIQLNSIRTVLTRVQPGQSISFISQWQATGSEAQLAVSLMDEAGHVWSTGDTNVPIAAQANVSRQRLFTLPVPLIVPPGDYRLVLNVVDVASGNLLHVRAADDQSSGGTDWPLGTIAIDPIQTLIDPATRIPPITLNADLGGLIRAIGSDRPPAPVISGDPWTLSMEWAALTDHLPALDVQWNVVAAGDSNAYSITLPLNPYSTDHWRKGEVLQSKYDFRLPITLTDGSYSLTFQLIDRAANRPLNTMPITLAPIKLTSRSRVFTPPSTLDHPLDFTFADLARLIGGDVDRGDKAITVTLYWRAQNITSTNATVFVQLVKPDGSIVQQIDHWQIAGDAPTSTWAPGQIVADPYTFDHVPAGECQVWVGLYDAADGQRLAVSDSSGHRLSDDRALAITIK